MLEVSFILMCFFWGLTLFGLYRPWLALWWTDYCPRIKVLRVYGSISLLLSILYGLLKLMI
jgi:hypothetical protein